MPPDRHIRPGRLIFYRDEWAENKIVSHTERQTDGFGKRLLRCVYITYTNIGNEGGLINYMMQTSVFAFFAIAMDHEVCFKEVTEYTIHWVSYIMWNLKDRFFTRVMLDLENAMK